MYFLAGLCAALFAYIINRMLVRRFGEKVIVFITPILEEGLKTGFALAFQTLILPVHIFFGIIEGVYDFWTSRMGISAGLLSVIWHTVFGLVTVLLQQMMGHVVYGILGAMLLHYVGNDIVVRMKEDNQ